MSGWLPFRKRYTPIQPQVEYAGLEGFSCREVKPSQALDDFVHCYWQLNIAKGQNESLPYRIVTDGCIDLYFELSPDHHNLEWASVMGTQREAVIVAIAGPSTIYGIRFYPTVFPVLARLDASELQGQEADLTSVSQTLYRSLQLAMASGDPHRPVSDRLNRWLISLLSANQQTADPRVLGALEAIIRSEGKEPLHRILSEPISERQLRRLFHQQVGESPKTFARIVRFQSTLNALLRESPHHIAHGYFDQSHLIREFKTCYGATPSTLGASYMSDFSNI